MLVVTQDAVGPEMAGPAIRAFEISRVLASEHEVTLAARHEPARSGDGFRVTAYDDQALRRLVADCDVLIAFGSLIVDHPWLDRTDVVVIADAYDPAPFEALVMHQEEPLDDQMAKHAAASERLLALLRRADLVLCASDRQRHLTVGMLAALGRVNPLVHAADPGLDDLVRVVPFGLPRESPAGAHPSPLRDRHPGLADDDFILLWGGGVYEWLDPVTLVEAVVAVGDPSVKAFFMGTSHPTPEVPQMPIVDLLRQRAEALGALDHQVFLSEAWVPYAERAGYLLDADVGVSLHRAHLEAVYAFRTRILDYLWAGLPVLCSEGDTFADLVAAHDLGEVVPIGEVGPTADAIRRLRDAGRREACRAHIREVAPQFTWDSVCRPIVEFCREPRRAPDHAPGLRNRSSKGRRWRR